MYLEGPAEMQVQIWNTNASNEDASWRVSVPGEDIPPEDKEGACGPSNNKVS